MTGFRNDKQQRCRDKSTVIQHRMNHRITIRWQDSFYLDDAEMCISNTHSLLILLEEVFFRMLMIIKQFCGTVTTQEYILSLTFALI